uniref:Zinc finger BED domain-containing protein 5-like n=1 Tax=Diabrotica virgifera virgifera TaxID=50390 RepID=A0A6P7FE06_DIAVI
MHGRKETIISSTDKISACSKKLTIWNSVIEKNDLTTFPETSITLINLKSEDQTLLKESMKEHLCKLQEGITKYFPSVLSANCEWLIALIEVYSDTVLKSKFSEVAPDVFWISVKNEYPKLAKRAVSLLLPFSTSYLCESAFSAINNIKSSYWSRLLDERAESVSVYNSSLDRYTLQKSSGSNFTLILCILSVLFFACYVLTK